MRIAIIAHTNAPWTPHYARFFLAQRHSVLVGSFYEGEIEGVDCVWLGTRRYKMGEHQYQYVTAIPRIRRMLGDFAPDVVFAPYLLSNGLAATLSWRGPLLVSARGGDILQQGQRSNVQALMQRKIVGFVARRATAIHSVSQELVDVLLGMGIPAERITCFPVGVDVREFEAPSTPERDPDPFHIICTRKQDHVYENHVLIDALHELSVRGRRFRCTMVAGGPLLAERKAQVEALGLSEQVTFTGHVGHEEIPRLLASAHLYVSASSSDGTSSSLLEALAAGAFPIVSRIRANADWVEDGQSGLVFAVGDSKALADALQRAMDDPELRTRAVLANRRSVEAKADMRRNMDRLEGLVESVAKSPGR